RGGGGGDGGSPAGRKGAPSVSAGQFTHDGVTFYATKAEMAIALTGHGKRAPHGLSPAPADAGDAARTASKAAHSSPGGTGGHGFDRGSGGNRSSPQSGVPDGYPKSR
ncbi:unnamed protein product, partial [Phaeothamnion confervicola]